MTALVAVFSLAVLGASAKCETDKLPISTGYDPNTGTLVSPVAKDPKWQVVGLSSTVAGIAPATPPYPAYDIKPYSGWATSASSNWISFIEGDRFDTQPGNQYSIVYRRSFRMCQKDEIKFDLRFACDNCVTKITVDGVVVFSQPLNNSTANFTSFTSLGFSMGLSAGTHNIEVTTYNVAASFPYSNPYGLNVDGALYSATGTPSMASEFDGCEKYICGGCEINDIQTCLSAANPGSYTFTAVLANTASNGYVKWDFGDGSGDLTPASNPVTNHVYAVGGTYKVCAYHVIEETGEKCEFCFEICVAKGAKEIEAQERRMPAPIQQKGVGALYPNPANTELNIPVVAGQAGDAEVVVRSTSGAVISRTVFPVAAGENLLRVPLAKMASGSYLAEIKGSWGREMKPFSKL